jgi:subtilase family serine protease
MNKKSLLVPALVFVLTIAGSAFAQKSIASPNSILGAQVVADPNAAPDAAARFNCELASFASGGFCYGPSAMQAAYGTDKLLNAGFDGTGQTIVIIDAFGSPTIDADLADFNARFGLPAPPFFQQIRMPGAPVFDPTNNDVVGWTVEIALDVEWAHAIAPGASIILVAGASDSFDDLLAAQNYAIDNRLGSVISESFGGPEPGLTSSADGLALLQQEELSYKHAADRKMTVFVSAGDSGTAFQVAPGVFVRAPQYPATSSFVTAVGGTNLFFGTATNARPAPPCTNCPGQIAGTYQGEVVWNDGGGAGGSGVSGFFALPNFQQHLPKANLTALAGHRGYPDISYNAGVVGGVIVHIGTINPNPAAFFLVGGTSAGAPQMAALGSIGNQIRGEPMGGINDKLYNRARKAAFAQFLHDITVGNNDFAGVVGFPAAAGWDQATGWGTPNAGLIQQIFIDDDE